MANVIDCPACHHELQVPPELLGQLVKCPLCAKTFTAPMSFLDEVAPAPANEPVPEPAVLTASAVPEAPQSVTSPPSSIRRGFRCPFCGTTDKPVTRKQISLAGWIVFGVLLAVGCLPLFWIGLLMKEDAKFCCECGRKLSGDSL